jgi:hypothetical protein
MYEKSPKYGEHFLTRRHGEKLRSGADPATIVTLVHYEAVFTLLSSENSSI